MVGEERMRLVNDFPGFSRCSTLSSMLRRSWFGDRKGIRPVENPCYLLPVVRPEQVAEETGGTDQPRFTGKMALKTAVGVMMVRSSC